jgi:Ca2+-binding EF-hand superfamily protein
MYSIKRYKATLKRTETLEGYYNAFVEENEHGNKFLSQQGFARAMLSRRLICVSEEKIRDTCNAFTNELLGDDNGNISLEEFHLLMSALQTPLEHISIYFRVMDVDGNGAIDKFEYEVFMRRLCALEGIQLQSLSNTRLLRHFFGVDGKGTVTNAQLRGTRSIGRELIYI